MDPGMAPMPFNEHHRLLSLYDCNVLDTPAEPEFDRITRLAAHTFQVPIALVSLVDPMRQWFKSAHGLEHSQTPREVSFCGHAIMSQEIMQVPDATEDPRFVDNPLVTGDPRIRFYAGAPLVTPQGFCLGTLCIIDRQPRAALTADQQAVLKDLAAMVVNELERRRTRGHFDEPLDIIGPKYAGNAVSSVREQELANEALIDLLGSLSHELRTPLNAILGFSEAIKKELFGPLENARYLAYAGHIFDSGGHLLGLVNNILDFSRMKHGEISLHEEPVPIEQLFDQCVSMFGEQVRRADITLESASADSVFVLRADRQQLTQMLVNLIGNSVKYTKAGGSIRVTQGLEADGTLTLAVSDSGIGIASEDLGRALVAFGQLDNELTRTHKGTGLGLPLTRRLAELHGGRLTIESREGVGTTVGLHFPAYRVFRMTCEASCAPKDRDQASPMTAA